MHVVDLDYVDIIVICQLCIGYFIFVPTLIYYCYQFNKIDANSYMLKHRNKRLVNYMNILSILSLSIEIPFEAVINVSNIVNKATYHWKTYATTHVFMCGLFVLFAIKSWLLYYNFEYHVSLSKLVWKKRINPRYRSWYILNKNKYGDLTHCLRILIIPFIIYHLIEMCMQFVFKTCFFVYTAVIVSLFAVIPSFILYRRLKHRNGAFTFHLKKFMDIFYQQITIYILIIIVFLKFIAQIIIKLVANIPTDVVLRVDRLLNVIILSVVIFLISVISSGYPVKVKVADSTSQECNLQRYASTVKAQFGVKPMLKCIADTKGFDAFMKHLVEEFAMESMLFLCEYIQIKHELQKKYQGLIKIKKTQFYGHNACDHDANDEYVVIDFNVINVDKSTFAGGIESPPSIIKQILTSRMDNDIFGRSETTSVRRGRGVYSYLYTSNGDLWHIIRLPARLPKAELLNTNHDFTHRLYALYRKYIEIDSIHEINIPNAQRQAIAKIFDNMEMEKEMEGMQEMKEMEYDEGECNLFGAFDETCIEIIHLMAHSYTRFASDIKSNNKLQVLQRINSDHVDDKKRRNKDSQKEEEENALTALPLLRNGKSYLKLRETYNLDVIEIWPFYL